MIFPAETAKEASFAIEGLLSLILAPLLHAVFEFSNVSDIPYQVLVIDTVDLFAHFAKKRVGRM